jgi:hypothetical protein
LGSYPTRPIHDPPPVAVEAIGRITVAWGRLEYTIKLAIKSCLGVGFDEGMLQAEEHMKLENMVEELRGLFSLQKWTPEELAEINYVLDKVLSLNEFRQHVIHSAWTADGDQLLMMRVRFKRDEEGVLIKDVEGRKQLDPLTIAVTLEYLQSFAAVVDRLWRYLNQRRNELPPSRSH